MWDRQTQHGDSPRNGKLYSVELLVYGYDGDLTPLLGLQASKQMKLINIQDDNFVKVHGNKVEDNYEDVMKGGLGTLEREHHLKVRPEVQPEVMPTRTVPISVRQKLKEELDTLETE